MAIRRQVVSSVYPREMYTDGSCLRYPTRRWCLVIAYNVINGYSYLAAPQTTPNGVHCRRGKKVL